MPNPENESNGSTDDEEEEGHDEVGERDAEPRRVIDRRESAAGVVDQNHQLHTQTLQSRDHDHKRGASLMIDRSVRRR